MGESSTTIQYRWMLRSPVTGKPCIVQAEDAEAARRKVQARTGDDMSRVKVEQICAGCRGGCPSVPDVFPGES